MSFWWKIRAHPVLPLLAVAFCAATLRAGEKLDPNSHAGKVTHAMQLFQQGKYHESEAEFRKLLSDDENERGLDHIDTLQDRKNLAIVLGVEGDFLGAEQVLHDAIDLESGLFGTENKDVLEFREILASTLAREGRNTEAARDFRDILAARERIARGAADVTVARAQSNLGNVLVDLGQFPEAEKLLRLAQPGLEKNLAPNDSAILLNRTNLYKSLIGLGRFAEAEKEQRITLTALQQLLGPAHPEVALATLNLAATLRAEKKLSEALELARRAESQLAQMLGSDNAKTKEAHQMSQELAEALPKKAGQ